VFLGDIVSFYTETLRIGRTSLTVKVLVEVERWSAGQGERIKVTEAEVVLVAVGPDGHPTPIRRDDASQEDAIGRTGGTPPLGATARPSQS
jgi:acyl-CoA thioesterase YciA